MDYQLWLDKIYDKVFCKTYSESYYIFLCGGAGKDCIRNDVRRLLESNGFQILYPEDLFLDIIYKDRDSDLLTYENFLANNADVVCVICESPGSFAEIGAFVQNEKISKRLIIAINSQFKRDKSFIMLGPVRHLHKENRKSIVYYKKNDLYNFINNLKPAFYSIKKNCPREHKSIDFCQLSAYIAFIPIFLFFFREISRKELHKELKIFLKSKDLYPNDYNMLFNATIKYLLKTRTISISYNDMTNEHLIILTRAGHDKTKQVISKSIEKNNVLLHDKIRCGIMKSQLNK